jgi:hypothetical protein
MEFDELDAAELFDTHRRNALLSAVGLWNDRTDLPDTSQYVRELRRADRLERISEG